MHGQAPVTSTKRRLEAAAPRGSAFDAAFEAYERKDYARAAQLFHQLARDPRSAAAANHYLGWIAFHTGNVVGSITYFEKSVAVEPKNSAYITALARAYGAAARSAGGIKRITWGRKAKSSLDEAVRLDPANTGARWGLMEVYLHAPAIFGGSVEKAKKEARQIRKYDPLLGHRASGRIHAVQKRRDLEEREYLMAHRNYPEARDPYFWLGHLYQQLQHYPKAFAIFEKRAQRVAADRAAFYEIGRTAAYSGERLARGLEALSEFERLPRFAPDEPSVAMVHLRRGQILARQGKRDAALLQLREAVRLDPRNEEAATALKNIQG